MDIQESSVYSTHIGCYGRGRSTTGFIKLFTLYRKYSLREGLYFYVFQITATNISLFMRQYFRDEVQLFDPIFTYIYTHYVLTIRVFGIDYYITINDGATHFQ